MLAYVSIDFFHTNKFSADQVYSLFFANLGMLERMKSIKDENKSVNFFQAWEDF